VDQVSPELALVDPALAAAARQALPVPTLDSPPRRPPAPAKRRRRRPTGLSLAVAALLAAVGVAAAVVVLAAREDARPEQVTAAAPAARVLWARKTKRNPPKVLPAPGAVPRVLTWHETKGAVSYYVALTRNGSQVYAAQTRDPWIRLPDEVRFVPGTYAWSVQPAVEDASGIVFGDAIVVRTIRVTRG
jgi:hypothetical protein